MAFYTPEALWYPAKLTGVFESADSVYYSVVFTGYNEEETIWPKHLRAQVASSFESQSDGGAAGWLTKKCTHRNQRQGFALLHCCGLFVGCLLSQAAVKSFALDLTSRALHFSKFS